MRRVRALFSRRSLSVGSWSGHLRTPEEDAKRLEAARCRAALPTPSERGEALLRSLLTSAQWDEFRWCADVTERRAGRYAKFSCGKVFEPERRMAHCLYPIGLHNLYADVVVANMLLWRADRALFDLTSRKYLLTGAGTRQRLPGGARWSRRPAGGPPGTPV